MMNVLMGGVVTPVLEAHEEILQVKETCLSRNMSCQQCGSVFRSPELLKTNFWDLSSQSMVFCYGGHRRLVCEFATFCHFQEEMSFAFCFFCFRWAQTMQTAGYTNSFSSVIFMSLLKKFKNTHSFKDLNV